MSKFLTMNRMIMYYKKLLQNKTLFRSLCPLIAGLMLCLADNTATAQFVFKSDLTGAGVSKGSIAFADVDKDGDEDVLITGDDNTRPIAKLYINDGSGNFTEDLRMPFADAGVEYSSIAFADVDKDEDQDVLITGWNRTENISKLYINDGSGGFTESGTSFANVNSSSIAFADVDKDGDQDALITGWAGDFQGIGQAISKLYINDGLGNFTEMGTPFMGISNGSIAFADVDKDGDEDVLITGDDTTRPIAKLYINDGSGGFIEALGTPFTGVEYSSIAFADVDKDEYQDVLITGEHSGGNAISRLYINDGSGGFTESGTSFTGVSGSSIAFADVDGDGYEDVFVTGSDIAKLYINDGSGGFTESGMSFTGVSGSSAAFSDMDKDGDQDVFVTGFDGSNQTAKLYTNQVFLIVSEPIVEVPENMTEVLTVMTTDTDVAVNYSLSGGADRSSFDINMNSGALTFQTNPDFEAPGSTNGDNTYDVEVTVQGGTRNITQTFTITVTDVNEAPVFAGGTVTFTIDEDADVNDDVGTPVTATDEDRPSQMLTYEITAGNDNNDFKIKANTGLIAVAKKLDHEAKGTYTLTVRADDGNGGTADATVTITVDDVNDPPVIGMIPDLTINENVSSGNVGSVIPVTDQDRPSQTLTYALSGTNHNDFAIDDTGQITVARTLDHETTDEYMLTLTVTDDGDGTLSDSKKLILTVTNVNDAPVIGTIPLDLTIAENVG
ncbi:MAG: VCBS repeat-containing protein, partial [Ekhidna sp.]|nr:VCBS repeat-containing protein [Ekhidna sp.]